MFGEGSVHARWSAAAWAGHLVPVGKSLLHTNSLRGELRASFARCSALEQEKSSFAKSLQSLSQGCGCPTAVVDTRPTTNVFLSGGKPESAISGARRAVAQTAGTI